MQKIVTQKKHTHIHTIDQFLCLIVNIYIYIYIKITNRKNKNG